MLKHRSVLSWLLGGACALTLVATPALAQQGGIETEAGQRETAEGMEKWQKASLTATVEEVNQDEREITLQGPEGKTRTFQVDERVQRLEEFQAGDQVNVTFYRSLAAELREPTEQEKQQPLQIMGQARRTPPDAQPGAAGIEQIKAVGTIESIDTENQTVEIKGPEGNTHALTVEDPTRLEQVQEGDTVVVTFTEALAISLEKQQ
jgi:Cu/Ag efflux protein CusF